MKYITIGIIAHVDAGKTTLSEALLYKAGNLRKLGRVDNGDAFLDPDALEKKRGITIFSHTAIIKTDKINFTLLDTPGHIDFAPQTENTLNVLDYGILVISATDGVTSYTRTLWQLLKDYQIPTFIFVNKMDVTNIGTDQIIENLQDNLDENCVCFMIEDDTFYENVATTDERTLEQYLNDGQVDPETIQKLIKERKVFPVYFGSALKLEGIDNLIAGLEKWSQPLTPEQDFAARVFKISHPQNGERLSWVRILGGELHAKEELPTKEKVDQIRIYNGTKFTTVQKLTPGQVGAITGLTNTYPGEGLGIANAPQNKLQPVLTYRVVVESEKIHSCLTALKTLQDENPSLQVGWNEDLQEIHVQIMGKMELEILQQLLAERFKLEVSFDQGGILYKETITQPIEAVGHFEPLRHYAEVHLLLEPGKANSGITLLNKCSLEVLSKNWQHQIMTSLADKQHLGVLIGAPITDIKITLIGGKGSNVHTVGGDFRQATYRAVRQGLMELRQKGVCKLLEPWYDFRLTVNNEQVGRAINDIQRMHGQFDEPQENNGLTVITGKAPVADMRDYVNEVRSYTHGEGQLECVVNGYRECHNSEEIIKIKNYDPVSDLENTPNSVFCSHGAGHTVTWDLVPLHAQYPYIYPIK